MEVGGRNEPSWRTLNLLEGETKRRYIRIPRLDIVV